MKDKFAPVLAVAMTVLKNKYLLVLVIALVWFTFLDKNNFIQHYRISRQIKELRDEKKYYREQIISDSLEIDKLRNNPQELERFAREKYLLKKKNEDIFIVKD